jgi:hypothetical protein
MDKDKIFTLDQESLEDQLKKIDDLIKRDKESITENDAIAKDPNHVFDHQGEWAEARLKGNLDALNRHEKMCEETKERLDKLKDGTNQDSEVCDRADS